MLRRARARRGLTLRELEEVSAGRYKASSVAGYERGERHISVERLCDLATFYEEDPTTLLGEALSASEEEGAEIRVDLTRLVVVLPDLEPVQQRAVTRLVSGFPGRARAPTVLRIDAQDLRSLAAETGGTPEELAVLLREMSRAQTPESPHS